MKKRKYANLTSAKTKAKIAATGCVLALAVLAAFLFKFPAKEAQAAPDSTLYLNPASLSVAMSQDFTLDAMINPGTNQVTGVSLRVTFDPSKFRLDGISAAGSPFSVTLLPAAINNATGTASIDVGVPPGSPTVPVTTLSTIATLSFHSLATATDSPIAFTGSSYAVAIGEGADVLSARNPSLVTVAGVTYSNADFANLAADWMQTLPSSPADVNSDGTVNSRDLGIMMSNWQ